MSDRIKVLADCLSCASFWHDPRLDIGSIGSRAHDWLIQQPGYIQSSAELSSRNVQGVGKDAAKAERTKAKADDFVRSAQPSEALKRYTTALKLASNAEAAGRDITAKLYCNRALCLLTTGSQQTAQQAEDDCTAAISLDPGYAKAYYRRALARQKQGRLREAKEDANEAAQLCPDWPQIQQLCQQLLKESHGRPPSASHQDPAAQGYGKALQVQDIPGEGRALVAAETLRAGEELIRDSPFAALPHKEQHDSVRSCIHAAYRLVGVMTC